MHYVIGLNKTMAEKKQLCVLVRFHPCTVYAFSLLQAKELLVDRERIEEAMTEHACLMMGMDSCHHVNQGLKY